MIFKIGLDQFSWCIHHRGSCPKYMFLFVSICMFVDRLAQSKHLWNSWTFTRLSLSKYFKRCHFLLHADVATFNELYTGFHFICHRNGYACYATASIIHLQLGIAIILWIPRAFKYQQAPYLGSVCVFVGYGRHSCSFTVWKLGTAVGQV